MRRPPAIITEHPDPPGRSILSRERLLTIEGGDPFAPVNLAHEAGDTSFPAAIAPEIVSEYPGRWVLMRPSEAGRVIADAADLDELLARDERQPGDVSAFVRDPSRQYA